MKKLAFHKKTDKNYIQYTVRLEEDILNSIKVISKKEEISINEVVNQSLKYAINDYLSEYKVTNEIKGERYEKIL